MQGASSCRGIAPFGTMVMEGVVVKIAAGPAAMEGATLVIVGGATAMEGTALGVAAGPLSMMRVSITNHVLIKSRISKD